jgi:hypothetical protein
MAEHSAAWEKMIKIPLKPIRGGYHICLEAWVSGETVHFDTWLMRGEQYIKFCDHIHLEFGQIVEIVNGRSVCASFGRHQLRFIPSKDGRRVRLVYRQRGKDPWWAAVSLNSLVSWVMAGAVK